MRGSRTSLTFPAGSEDRLLRVEDRLFTYAIFVVAAVLLVSVGGEGIVAAPIVIPLLYWRVHRRPTRPMRFVGGLLAGFTAAELAWGVVYALAGQAEPKPWIWLIPAICGLGALALFARIGRR